MRFLAVLCGGCKTAHSRGLNRIGVKGLIAIIQKLAHRAITKVIHDNHVVLAFSVIEPISWKNASAFLLSTMLKSKNTRKTMETNTQNEITWFAENVSIHN